MLWRWQEGQGGVGLAGEQFTLLASLKKLVQEDRRLTAVTEDLREEKRGWKTRVSYFNKGTGL